MTIAITKAIPASQVPNSQAGNFSPNLDISYWVVGTVTLDATLAADAEVGMQGFFDQAGYQAQQKRPMGNMQIVIPAADTAAALATDASLGAYLLTLPQFTGGVLQ